ncbi:S8 family peptidase [Dyadobacter sp. CY312]|uniref:S8 family peptidase n=1 Tax=Dyadobacter sp. CY312 TaxID=2907303 RepID=UPI001F389FC0|nr:S8 family peptidase [Dyadobacter sp. CY312]MCE7044400.1 S8 family peptidase [Dyadobacter sp. CY312]
MNHSDFYFYNLLADSTTTHIRNDTSTFYLAKISSESTRFFRESLNVVRQLESDLYIIRTSPLWVKNNLSNFVFIRMANNSFKLSPSLINKNDLELNSKKIFHITVNNNDSFEELLSVNPLKYTLKQSFADINTFILECEYDFIKTVLINDENVIYIESGDRQLIEERESQSLNFKTPVNEINLVHSEFPEINGSGITASIKENLFDTTNIDFKGRIRSTPEISSQASTHATQMARIIGGGGNSHYSAKGVAWKANLSSSSANVLLPNTNDFYLQHHITVQNHSYGVGIETFYGNDSKAYDYSTANNPSLIHIFSAGNSGEISSNEGIYKMIPNFANLSGSFKAAKNVLTIGTVNSEGKVRPISSRGPTNDGRVKPELVAFSDNGTSESAATVSGIALLLQDAYKKSNSGSPLENGLLKAILINGADDVESDGIDFLSGYGSVNAYASIENIHTKRYIIDSVSQTSPTKTFQLKIPKNACELKISLVWIDPPAAPNSYRSIINDLDLSLKDNISTKELYPWVLNHFPDSDSLRLIAKTGRDSINVVEQITVPSPISGDYYINVKAYHLQTSSQKFFVAYKWDTLNKFKWTYPVDRDQIEIGSGVNFRWKTTFKSKKGRLEYSQDNGQTWEVINSGVDLSKNIYHWNTLNSIGTFQARMIIDTVSFNTKKFSISSPIIPSVGYNCPDSVLLHWKPGLNAIRYEVFNLDRNYLKQIAAVTDTIVSIPQGSLSTPYLAVSTILDNQLVGNKGLTFDINDQGTGCYFKSFLVDHYGQTAAKLLVSFGTTYNLKLLFYEKLSKSGWVTLSQQAIGVDFTYNFIDENPSEGVNFYRIRLRLNGNIEVVSEVVSLYFIVNTSFIIYPNPVKNDQILYILFREYDNYNLKIYDSLGRTVLGDQQLNSLFGSVRLNMLLPGNYIIEIANSHGNKYRQKIIVI